jgi:hypothetical protein
MIDTLADARHLEAADIDRTAAEPHIDAIMRSVIPDIATEGDISELKVGIVATTLTVAAFAVTFAKRL